MTKRSMQKGRVIDPYQLSGTQPNAPILLAFSGGADSVALLDMLQKEYSKAPILLAHVNHGIRGEEALRDRVFCESIAKERGLEIAILNADIPTLAKERGQSLEEAAREVRYAFFADLMKEREIPLLVTAHHADDHLETILFRIARGTGISGLCGIAPIRPFQNGFLVRPMLGFTKKEILEYCQAQGLDYVIDSTNADTAYARNRIRAEVLPVMESLYADASHRAVRMSAELCEDEALLCSMAAELVEQNTTARGINLQALQKAHSAIRRRALQMWFEKECGATLEFVHLQALTDMILEGDKEARVALPTGVSAYCTASGRLSLTKTKPQPVGEYALPLTLGESMIPNTDISIRITPTEGSDKAVGQENALVLFGDWEELEKSFTWRNRREGDVILRGKMHRQLRRLWAKKGIPTELRQALPLLVSEKEIVWVPFVGSADELKQKMAQDDASSAFKIEINVPDHAF